jgi:hypothetical protein
MFTMCFVCGSFSFSLYHNRHIDHIVCSFYKINPVSTKKAGFPYIPDRGKQVVL